MIKIYGWRQFSDMVFVHENVHEILTWLDKEEIFFEKPSKE